MNYFATIFVLITLFSYLCESKTLSENELSLRDEETNNWPKIIGLKQFEDFLRLIQQQIYQVNNQLLKLVETSRPLFYEDSGVSITPEAESTLSLVLKQIQDNIRNLQKSFAALVESVSRRIGGGLQSDSSLPVVRIPFISELQEMVALWQKQIANFANVVTKTLGANRDGQSGSYYNNDDEVNIPGINNIPQIPFLNEFREYVQLFQKQLSRFVEQLRRVVRVGGDNGL